MNALNTSGDKSEEIIGEHLSAVEYTTNSANIACNTIGINQLIDDGYNTNALIDLSDTLHKMSASSY